MSVSAYLITYTTLLIFLGIIYIFWDTQHIFNVFFVKNVDIIQSVSGSCFVGVSRMGVMHWVLFLCRPYPFIYMLEGKVGEPEG